MCLRWMKRQSDQLGFNCDLLLMLFLGVFLLLKINQFYRGNEVQWCKNYSFFTFKQPGDCFRSIFCYIMQASVCLEEHISRNELLVCEERQIKMIVVKMQSDQMYKLTFVFQDQNLVTFASEHVFVTPNKSIRFSFQHITYSLLSAIFILMCSSQHEQTKLKTKLTLVMFLVLIMNCLRILSI